MPPLGTPCLPELVTGHIHRYTVKQDPLQILEVAFTDNVVAVACKVSDTVWCANGALARRNLVRIQPRFQFLYPGPKEFFPCVEARQMLVTVPISIWLVGSETRFLTRTQQPSCGNSACGGNNCADGAHIRRTVSSSTAKLF